MVSLENNKDGAKKLYTVIVVVVFAVYLGVSTWYYMSVTCTQPDCDLFNWQAVAIEIPAGVILAVLFYYFQWRSGNRLERLNNSIRDLLQSQSRNVERIDEVVRITAEMAAQEQARQEKRKRVWAEIAHLNLVAISAGHKDLYRRYMYLVEDKPTQDYYTEFLKWAHAARELTRLNYVPELDDALSHLLELLDDPSLFTDIRENYRDFYDMYQMAGLPRTIDELDKQKILNRLPGLNSQEKLVKTFIERIKKEMPSKTTI